ncbi:MAG: sigma-54 dependent transcriptional regulator [bacterium]
MRVLIIEDEAILRVSLQDELREHGYEVDAFEDPVAAMESFRSSPAPIVISDLRLPRMSGMALLSRIKSLQPETIVILMTAYGEVSTAVEAMKKGAYDYLTKPFDLDELVLLLERACDVSRLREENERLRQQTGEPCLIGDSEPMSLLRNAIETAARSDLTVLLTGETGTGKDLSAQLVHRHPASRRAKHAFVKISCAQYSQTVLESELFGHEQGAFTGATRKKKGKFLLAHQGTVYLDDVDDLSPEIQVKLLRVLDEKVVEPVGSLQQIPVDIRIIASTKKDLSLLIRERRFRDDLLYRLNAYPVRIPSLREHKEDIALLLRNFWDRAGHPDRTLTEGALRALEGHRWPGNVRELRNLAGRLALSCRSALVTKQDIPAEIAGAAEDREPQARTFDEIIAATERDLLSVALQEASGNQSQAARILGMKLSTFRDRLTRHAIHIQDRNGETGPT